MVNICWTHCWLKLVEICVLVIHLMTCSYSGWVLMTNIFLVSKSMDHQLSNALSTMFLRRLVMFYTLTHMCYIIHKKGIQSVYVYHTNWFYIFVSSTDQDSVYFSMKLYVIIRFNILLNGIRCHSILISTYLRFMIWTFLVS